MIEHGVKGIEVGCEGKIHMCNECSRETHQQGVHFAHTFCVTLLSKP